MSEKKKSVKVKFNQNVKFKNNRHKAGDVIEVSQEDYETLVNARVIDKKDD